MHSTRTSPPTSSENYFGDRPPNAGDWINDAITDLRSGDASDFIDDEDEAEMAQEKSALEGLRSEPHDHTMTLKGNPEIPRTEVYPPAAPQPQLPPVLHRIFGTDAEEELMAVARHLDPKERRNLTLVFHTPVGDVKCPVNWSSTNPEMLDKTQHLLLILVRSSASMFAPRPGAELEISFISGQGHRSPRLKVTSLAAPMQLYPGVGIDLLCFLPHADDVEKTGRLADRAPSVVSGKPSDHVDEETGEPVAAGEKSAALKVPPHLAAADKAEDFDKPRGD